MYVLAKAFHPNIIFAGEVQGSRGGAPERGSTLEGLGLIANIRLGLPGTNTQAYL